MSIQAINSISTTLFVQNIAVAVYRDPYLQYHSHLDSDYFNEIWEPIAFQITLFTTSVAQYLGLKIKYPFRFTQCPQRGSACYMISTLHLHD